MRGWIIAVLLAGTWSAIAQADPPADAAGSGDAARAAQEYAAVKAEHEKANATFMKAYQASKSDVERKAALATRPKGEDFAPRFKAIAAANPATPAAADCLAWIVGGVRDPAQQAEALDLLAASHLGAACIPQVCSQLQYAQAKNAESFLRLVLEKGPTVDGRASACNTLGRILKGHADLAARIKASDEKFAKQVEAWIGAETVARLVAAGPEALTKEAEGLFDRVVTEFAAAGTGNYAASAKGDLFELRNLAVGMTAPDVVGADEDSNPLKLSDFRGKVVLLDFWGEW